MLVDQPRIAEGFSGYDVKTWRLANVGKITELTPIVFENNKSKSYYLCQPLCLTLYPEAFSDFWAIPRITSRKIVFKCVSNLWLNLKLEERLLNNYRQRF